MKNKPGARGVQGGGRGTVPAPGHIHSPGPSTASALQARGDSDRGPLAPAAKQRRRTSVVSCRLDPASLAALKARAAAEGQSVARALAQVARSWAAGGAA